MRKGVLPALFIACLLVGAAGTSGSATVTTDRSAAVEVATRDDGYLRLAYPSVTCPVTGDPIVVAVIANRLSTADPYRISVDVVERDGVTGSVASIPDTLGTGERGRVTLLIAETADPGSVTLRIRATNRAGDVRLDVMRTVTGIPTDCNRSTTATPAGASG
jgi:ABC-type uncharacterized transport system YnjBCD ATPase subunit